MFLSFGKQWQNFVAAWLSFRFKIKERADQSDTKRETFYWTHSCFCILGLVLLSTEIRPSWNPGISLIGSSVTNQTLRGRGLTCCWAILGRRPQENTNNKERCALKFRELWSLKSHLCWRLLRVMNSCRRSLLCSSSSLRRRHSSHVGTSSIFQHPGGFDFTASSPT